MASSLSCPGGTDGPAWCKGAWGCGIGWEAHAFLIKTQQRNPGSDRFEDHGGAGITWILHADAVAGSRKIRAVRSKFLHAGDDDDVVRGTSTPRKRPGSRRWFPVMANSLADRSPSASVSIFAASGVAFVTKRQ